MANAENVKLDQELKRLKIKSLKDNGQDMELLLDKMLDTITKEDKSNEPR